MSQVPLVAMAGFASGWMLLWAAAGAIPLILHLLARRQRTTVPWAAMQLLLEVVQQEAKRVRFEQLLLLLLRISILVVLALALARPFLRDRSVAGSGVGDTPPRLWVLALDVSYSMGYRDDEQSRFQNAQRQALEIVQSSVSGDAFVLLEMADRCRPIIRQPTFDREEVLSALRRMTVLDTGCDARDGLRISLDVLSEAEQMTGLPQDVQVVLFTDLGRDSWEVVSNEDGRAQLRQLSQAANLQVINVAEPDPTNLAVSELKPDVRRGRVGQTSRWTVRVDNHSDQIREKLPVQFLVDGQTVESQVVSIDPRSSQSIEFQVVPRDSGYQSFSVMLPNDRLAADNQRLQVMQVVDRDRILFAEHRSGAAKLIRASLQPRQGLADSSRFLTISTTELPSVNLEDWDVLVLCDLQNLDADTLQRLLRFAREGGGIVCCLGPHTALSTLADRPEVSSTGRSELLGFEPLAQVADEDLEIDALDYQSPITAPFAGFPDAGLLTTPVFRYWSIRTVAERKLTVDLGFTNGDPLVVRRSLGRGQVVSILSSPASGIAADGEEAWNAMAAWPSFVPMMHRIVESVLEADSAMNNVLAGQPLRGSQAASSQLSQVTIVRPDGLENRVVTEQQPQSKVRTWQYTRTQQQGLYVARQPSGVTVPYAVNIRPNESSLESIVAASLPVSAANNQAKRTTSGERANDDSHNALARWLLAVLALLLVTESSFARWIGRRVG